MQIRMKKDSVGPFRHQDSIRKQKCRPRSATISALKRVEFSPWALLFPWTGKRSQHFKDLFRVLINHVAEQFSDDV